MSQTLASDASTDGEPILARIAQLAARRIDAEVLNLLRSDAALVAQKHALPVVAAALRAARHDFGTLYEAHGTAPPVTALVEVAAALRRPYPLTGRFPGDPAHREYLHAAIDWYDALRETPYFPQFWSAMDEIVQADLGALFDVQSRVIGLIAKAGMKTELPEPLDAYVMGFVDRIYVLSDAHNALDLLTYAIRRTILQGRLDDVACELLPDWCHYFARADIHNRDLTRHLYRLRDRLQAQFSAGLRDDPLLSRRYGTIWTTFAVALLRIGRHPFFHSKGFVTVYGFRRWLQTMRRIFGWLERRPFRRAGAAPRQAHQIVGTRQDILVTRHQGGLGDIMTMRPGLRALARANPRARVVFATKRGHFSLFSVDDPIELVDIDSVTIDHRSFGRWIDLSCCPCWQVEIAQMPKVRTQRIAIFADAMGAIGAPALEPIRFAPDLEAAADAFLAAHGPADRPAIGIQLRAADGYKDYPALLDVARALSTRYRVFVFDNRAVPTRDGDRFVAVTDQPFGVVMAIAAKAAAIVTPDSALLHLAGANRIPCVGIFGPTDGHLHAAVYPTLRAVDLRAALPCVPCWRNEYVKCGLSDSYRSVCLEQLPTAAIIDAVEDVLARQKA